jgi:hypothetical protein
MRALTIQRHMWFSRSTPSSPFSELAERLQRLESAHAELLARIAGEAALRRLTCQVSTAASVAPMLGSALEGFASAMRRPLKRGRAGGIARARQATELWERWRDGRFMAHEDSEQIGREIAEQEYMRYATGGFARAASASRASDGTFLPARVYSNP